MKLALLGIGLILIVVWLYRRRPAAPAAKPETSSLADMGSGKYHAVSIRLDANACDTAKAMSGRRFLSSAAPRLPLPECDALECNCRFTHHKDRRTGKDRRSPFAAAGFGGGTGSFEMERREQSGRRKEDQEPDDDF